ncbi:hypothetical protein P7D86_01255 [Enterococcus avium]|uniref:hypothetical protein n=1 Tax=Enterococcus avium TaxID=33945 RepID=UPI00289130C3|nr:hypothetical protein [Enterococcus avium]MDT2425449.1 hypothetical protein [Enterococcus avium]
MSKIRAIPKVMEDAVFEATFDIVDETVARATSHLQSSTVEGRRSFKLSLTRYQKFLS